MTTSVRHLRGSSVEPNTADFKTKQSSNTDRLLSGRNLLDPIGSASNPIPPTDSPVYKALQRYYGTKDFLGLL